jgi:phage terminase small subunit
MTGQPNRRPRKRLMPLRRSQFIHEYLRDLDATAAVVRAGYSTKSAKSTAHTLMQDTAVQAEIQAAFARRVKRMELKQDDVVRELMAVAFADIGTFVTWDDSGLTLKPSSSLDKGDTAVISEVIHTVSEKGGTTRVKLHSKMEALNMLSRHLGMFVERVEHTGRIDISADIYQSMSVEEAQGMLKELRSRKVLDVPVRIVEGEGKVE